MSPPTVALVTGVSSGIGQAIASLLVKKGFRTIGTLRDMGTWVNSRKAWSRYNLIFATKPPWAHASAVFSTGPPASMPGE